MKMNTATVTRKRGGIFDPALIVPALTDALRKLDPRHQVKSPVMFVVEVGALITSFLWVRALYLGNTAEPAWFVGGVSVWLWLTILFANFSEALAEGRGQAQANSLRATRRDTKAKVLPGGRKGDEYFTVAATELKKGTVVLVEAGEVIPMDGEVIDGVASVNEAAITGESAPVIRESGGDRSAVTGGTTVLSDWLVVRVTADPGETFLDRMISMVEGAKRQKTPNEIALNALLAGMTIIFLLATATLLPFSVYSATAAGKGSPLTMTVLIALLVCLIPTTIGGLLPAIGIAGMDRMIRFNVVAMSGRAIEAAGDVDVLLLDKTGTITLGNRQAVEFIPVSNYAVDALADAAQIASLADETPEGRSIVVLAKQKYRLRGRNVAELGAKFVHFSAQTRMSGVDFAGGRQIRKGSLDAIEAYVKANGATLPEEVGRTCDRIAKQGGTPLVVASEAQTLGVIHLKDIVKGGIKERFSELRGMGIKTVMITGDNPVTAAAIAAEAGVDDFLAQATPENKLKLIRDMQAGGRLVAMTGDGTNDAPALAQADVAVAMNTGTQAAKEAGNMVDLDSNPTKLIEIVQIGKQLLITRGALTTFSIANDVAKYFAIVPAAFASIYPVLGAMDIMGLSPKTAILCAVIFNALIIVALIPLALRGVQYRAVGAHRLLRDHALIYGLGGLIVPFVGIKLIDMALSGVGRLFA